MNVMAMAKPSPAKRTPLRGRSLWQSPVIKLCYKLCQSKLRSKWPRIALNGGSWYIGGLLRFARNDELWAGRKQNLGPYSGVSIQQKIPAYK